MSSARDPRAETGAAPPGEQIHMPAPSLVPIVTAVFITLAIVGLTIWHGLVVIGGVGFLICLAVWIRHTRRDVASLPPEHH